MTERVTTTKKKRRPTRVAPPKRPVTAAKPGVTTTPGSTVAERRRPCATEKTIPESKSPETSVTKRPSAPFRAEPPRAAAVRSAEGQPSVTPLTDPVTVTNPIDERLERVLDRLFEGAVNAERFLYEELLAFVAGRFPDAFAAISRWLEEQVGPLDDDDDLEPEDGAESAEDAGLDSRGPTGPTDLYDGPRARERSTT